MNQSYTEMVFEILSICGRMACQDELLWHNNLDPETKDEEPIKFMFNCSDTFDWGSADGEEITMERMPILRQAVEDVVAVIGIDQVKAWLVTVIYCGRIRRRRPIREFYTQEWRALWPLFDSLDAPQETGA